VKVSHLHSNHCASRRTHDLRHTHETWLIEHRAPRILRLVRLGHKRRDIDDVYSHVTPSMIGDMLAALQQRWAQHGGRIWQPDPTIGSEMI
jgi:integrase